MFGTLDGLGLLRHCVTLHALHVLHEQERWKYGEWKDGEWRRKWQPAQPGSRPTATRTRWRRRGRIDFLVDMHIGSEAEALGGGVHHGWQ